MELSQPDVIRQAVSPQLAKHPDQNEVEKLRLMGAGDNPTETETRLGQELLTQQLVVLGIKPITNVRQLKSWHEFVALPLIAIWCRLVLWANPIRILLSFLLTGSTLCLSFIALQMHWPMVIVVSLMTVPIVMVTLAMIPTAYEHILQVDFGWLARKINEKNTSAQAYQLVLKLRQALPGCSFWIEHNPGTTGYFLMAGLAGYPICLDYWRSGKQEPNQISIPNWIAGRELVLAVEKATS